MIKKMQMIKRKKMQRKKMQKTQKKKDDMKDFFHFIIMTYWINIESRARQALLPG